MAQAQIKAVITAEDKASATLKGFGNKVENLGSNMLNVAKKASLAFGAAGLAATTFAVKSAADFEQTRIGLENMLGSADAARAMLAKVSKFAAETPFEFPELAQATRQLIAFGFGAEDAFETMTQLGDVSAAIGAPIGDLSYLMGTLRAQGRAFTIDIRQFAMRGIPIYEYLAKVFKTNTKEVTKLIEAGKVGFPEVQKAFELMTGEGGKFHGTMAKQSKSLTGLFSTLKDVIGQTARELVGITQEGDVKEGSLFDNLRKGTAWLIENLPMMLQKMRDVFNYVKEEIVPQLRQWADNITEVGVRVAEYLLPKLQELWNTMKEDLIPAFTEFWKEIIVPLLPVLGTGLVIAIGAVIDAVRILSEAQAILMRHIVFLKDTAVQNWQIMIRQIQAVIQWGKNLNQWFARLPGVVKGSISGLTKILTAPFSAMANVIEGVINNIERLKRIFEGVKDVLRVGSTNITGGSSNLSKALDPFGIFRASGGSVSGGSPYVVGEQGAELFVPGQSGTIVPNHKLGGSGTTINLNVNVGMYAGSEMEKRKMAEELMRSFQDVVSSRNMAWGNM